jgi:hypothetical protein
MECTSSGTYRKSLRDVLGKGQRAGRKRRSRKKRGGGGGGRGDEKRDLSNWIRACQVPHANPGNV